MIRVDTDNAIVRVNTASNPACACCDSKTSVEELARADAYAIAAALSNCLGVAFRVVVDRGR